MAMASVMKDAYHTVGCAVEVLRAAFGEQSGMAETEIVTRFKEFARVRLLAALREADSAGVIRSQWSTAGPANSTKLNPDRLERRAG
jgi:hypothetical protein